MEVEACPCLLYTSLRSEIARILGLTERKRMIQLGSGNLGRAIASNIDFGSCGFELMAIFDTNEFIVGSEIKEFPLLSLDKLETFCRQHRPTAAALCIPQEGAEELVPRLIELGITSFLNFSHYDIAIHFPHTAVVDVNIADSLMTLAYQAAALEEEF